MTSPSLSFCFEVIFGADPLKKFVILTTRYSSVGEGMTGSGYKGDREAHGEFHVSTLREQLHSNRGSHSRIPRVNDTSQRSYTNFLPLICPAGTALPFPHSRTDW